MAAGRTLYQKSNWVGYVNDPKQRGQSVSRDLLATAGTEYSDSATVNVSVSPSGVDAGPYIDAATVGTAVTASAVEVAAFVDSATVGCVITPSGVDVYTPASATNYTDAATVGVGVKVSASELYGIAEAAIVPTAITVTTTDVFAPVEASTVRATVTVITTFEHFCLYAPNYSGTIVNRFNLTDIFNEFGAFMSTDWRVGAVDNRYGMIASARWSATLVEGGESNPC